MWLFCRGCGLSAGSGLVAPGAAFGSLTTGFGIGVVGQARARVACDYTLETLIWGALTTRALTMIADQRAWLAAQSAPQMTAKKAA